MEQLYKLSIAFGIYGYVWFIYILLISIFIIWVEILIQDLPNLGQASYPFEATFDELNLPCQYCVCVCVYAPQS